MPAASAKSRWILVAVVAAALAVLAALLIPRFIGGDTISRSAGASTDPANTPIPAPLDWQPCEDSDTQQCAFLPVPKTWANPTGPTFQMHVRRLPSPADPGQKIGSLFLNTGGPGMASSGYVLDQFFGDQTEVRSRFDIVWPDPRGTGKSQPVLQKCPMDPLLDGQQPAAGPFAWPQVTGFRLDQQTPLNAECLRRNATDGTLIGTNEVVRDLDLLRQALGEEQITYLGYSYGTRLGTQYAKAFPQRVRAMVLDGTVDPSGTVVGLGQTQAAGGKPTAEWVRSALSPQMRAVYDDVVRYLQTSTITADGVTTSRWSFGYNVLGNAGAFASADAIGYIVGDTCSLARAAGLPSDPCPPQQAQPPDPADAAGVTDIPLPGASATVLEAAPARQLVNCADLSGRPDANALAGLMPPRGSVEEPLTPSFVLMYASQCAGYPQAWSPIGPMTTVTGPVPLFVNGTADPATPLNGARAMQANFPGSRMISLDTAKHGIYPSANSACVNVPVTAYLISGTQPPGDITCPAGQ